jgi:hypothetical protein
VLKDSQIVESRIVIYYAVRMISEAQRDFASGRISGKPVSDGVP